MVRLPVWVLAALVVWLGAVGLSTAGSSDPVVSGGKPDVSAAGSELALGPVARLSFGHDDDRQATPELLSPSAWLAASAFAMAFALAGGRGSVRVRRRSRAWQQSTGSRAPPVAHT